MEVSHTHIFCRHVHRLGSSGDEGYLQGGTGDRGGSGGRQNVCENTAIKSKNKIKIRKYSNFKKLPREALSQKPKKKVSKKLPNIC